MTATTASRPNTKKPAQPNPQVGDSLVSPTTEKSFQDHFQHPNTRLPVELLCAKHLSRSKASDSACTMQNRCTICCNKRNLVNESGPAVLSKHTSERRATNIAYEIQHTVTCLSKRAARTSQNKKRNLRRCEPEVATVRGLILQRH